MQLLKMKKLVVFLSLTIIVSAVFAQESGSAKDIISKNVKCVLEDKSPADKCITDFFTEIRPHLKVGIPELEVPALDPFHIDQLSFPDDSVLVQGKSTIYNITVNGLGDYTIKKTTVDYDKQIVTLHMFVKKTEIDGLYTVDGNFLILPIKGDGKMNINFTDVDINLIATLERTGKGINLSSLDVDFDPKHIDIFMANLLGDREVSDAINKLINDNAQEVVKELKPTLKVKLAASIKHIIANIIKEIPGEILIKQI